MDYRVVGSEYFDRVNDVPHGFIFEFVAKQLDNFIGTFLEYDSTTIQLGYKGKMRIKGSYECEQPFEKKQKAYSPERYVCLCSF